MILLLKLFVNVKSKKAVNQADSLFNVYAEKKKKSLMSYLILRDRGHWN